MPTNNDLGEFASIVPGGANADLGDFATIVPKPRGVIAAAASRASDLGISALKGAIGVPETFIGLADMATNGGAGKLAESAGFRAKDAKAALDELYSPEQQAANQAVNEAQGFFPTVGAMLHNPSTIVHQAVESFPTMLSGGAIARGAMWAGLSAAEKAAVLALPKAEQAGAVAAASKLGQIGAGALGEGATTAGQNLEQVRQEDPNGTVTPGQSALMAASGALTGLIGLKSGQLANHLGLGEASTMMAGGHLGPVGEEAIAAGAKKGILRKIGEGALVEGVGQELPQSYQEQVAQNLAQGKPWDEGAAAAGAQGMLAGGLMGAVAGPLHSGHEVDTNTNTTQTPPPPIPTSPITAAATTAVTGMPPATPPGPLTAGAALVQPSLLFPFSDKANAQKRADALTNSSGVPHEVTDHPIRAGSFAATPVPAKIDPDDSPDAGTEIGAAPPAAPPAAPQVAFQPGDLVQVTDKGVDQFHKGTRIIGLSDDGQSATVESAMKNRTVPVASLTRFDPAERMRMDQAAHDSATSPYNDRAEPTEAMKEAGNYKKGSYSFQGLPLKFENAVGSTRTGEDPDGKKWSTTMRSHYGYVRGTVGGDGQEIDFYAGPNPLSHHVFVVDQVDPKTGQFDEHKVMGGFNSAEQARRAYDGHYAKDWKGGAQMTATTIDGFKQWLNDSDTTKQFANAQPKPAQAGQQAAAVAPVDAAPTGPTTPAISPAGAPTYAALSDAGQAEVRQKQGEVLGDTTDHMIYREVDEAAVARDKAKTPLATTEHAAKKQHAADAMDAANEAFHQNDPTLFSNAQAGTGGQTFGQLYPKTAQALSTAVQRAPAPPVATGPTTPAATAAGHELAPLDAKIEAARAAGDWSLWTRLNNERQSLAAADLKATPTGATTPAPATDKPAKPRLAETADELYRAIKAQGEIHSPQGKLHPVVRVLGMGDMRVTDKGVEVLTTNGMGVRDATAQEVADLHEALEHDQAQVLAMSQWRSDKPSEPVQVLHSPSGNGFQPWSNKTRPIGPGEIVNNDHDLNEKARQARDGTATPAAEPAVPDHFIRDANGAWADPHTVYADLIRAGWNQPKKNRAGLELHKDGETTPQLVTGDDNVAFVQAELARQKVEPTGTAQERRVAGSDPRHPPGQKESTPQPDGNEQQADEQDQESANTGTAPEHARNQGKPLDPNNKFVPLYGDQEVKQQAPINGELVPLTMSATDFAEITNEFAALFAAPDKYVQTEKRVAQATVLKAPEPVESGPGKWTMAPSPATMAALKKANWEAPAGTPATPTITMVEDTDARSVKEGKRHFRVTSNYTNRYDSTPVTQGDVIQGKRQDDIKDGRDSGRVGSKQGLAGGIKEIKAMWLELESAILTQDEWIDHAIDQAEDSRIRQGNSQKVILSLFDYTGEWGQPWADAGYNVIPIDIQNGIDVHDLNAEYLYDHMGVEGDIYGMLIAVPCTDMAVAGAKHFAAKDADGRTEASKELVIASLTLVEELRPTGFWTLENPVSRIEALTGLPPSRMSFDPNHFGHAYTKKTILWGNFNTDLPLSPVEPVLGSKMHQKFGGSSQETKNARSETPRGFAAAFFMGNNYADLKPEQRLTSDYPEASGAIATALKAGVPEDRIRALMEETYENDEFEDARNALIEEVAALKAGKGDYAADDEAQDEADDEAEGDPVPGAAWPKQWDVDAQGNQVADKPGLKQMQEAKAGKDAAKADDKPLDAAIHHLSMNQLVEMWGLLKLDGTAPQYAAEMQDAIKKEPVDKVEKALKALATGDKPGLKKMKEAKAKKEKPVSAKAQAEAEQQAKNEAQREQERANARAHWKVGMVTSLPPFATVQGSDQRYTQMLPGVIEAIDGDTASVRIYAAPEYGYRLENYPLHGKLAVDVPLVELGGSDGDLDRVMKKGLLATGDPELAADVRSRTAKVSYPNRKFDDYLKTASTALSRAYDEQHWARIAMANMQAGDTFEAGGKQYKVESIKKRDMTLTDSAGGKATFHALGIGYHAVVREIADQLKAENALPATASRPLIDILQRDPAAHVDANGSVYLKDGKPFATQAEAEKAKAAGKPSAAEDDAGQAEAPAITPDAGPRATTLRERHEADEQPDLLDLHKQPTGWRELAHPNSNGVTLVSSDGQHAVEFISADFKSGTESRRAFARAHGYAIDNPYQAPKTTDSDTPAGTAAVRVPPETDGDIAHREWRENYQAVINDVEGASDKNITRAIGYASHVIVGYQPRAFAGDANAKSMIGSLRTEIDFLESTLKARKPGLQRMQDAKAERDGVKAPAAEGTTAAPQHIENGQAEPVTQTVIAASIRKSAANTVMNNEQARKDLLQQIDAAIAKAPGKDPITNGQDTELQAARAELDKATAKQRGGNGERQALSAAVAKAEQRLVAARRAVSYIVFDVPGDGRFEVRNVVANLTRFRAQVEQTEGFKGATSTRTKKSSIRLGTSPETAIADMLEQGEMVAAHALAREIGAPFRFTPHDKGDAPNLYLNVRDVADMPHGISGYVGRLYGSKRSPWIFIESRSGRSIGDSGSTSAAAAEKSARDKLNTVSPDALANAIQKMASTVADQATLEAAWLAAAEKSDEAFVDEAAAKSAKAAEARRALVEQEAAEQAAHADTPIGKLEAAGFTVRGTNDTLKSGNPLIIHSADSNTGTELYWYDRAKDTYRAVAGSARSAPGIPFDTAIAWLKNWYADEAKARAASTPAPARTDKIGDQHKERQAAAGEPASADATADAGRKVDAFAAAAGYNPMKTGQAKKALSTQIRRDGGEVMSTMQFVETLVNEGLTTSSREEDKIKPMSRREFNRADNAQQAAHERRIKEAGTETVHYLGNYAIGAIPRAYADYLIAQRDAEAASHTQYRSGIASEAASILRDIQNKAKLAERNDVEPLRKRAMAIVEQIRQSELPRNIGDMLVRDVDHLGAQRTVNQGKPGVVDAGNAKALRATLQQIVDMAEKAMPAVTVAKIGDPVRIMGTDAILADTREVDGVRYELYNANKISDKRGFVRVVDVDSGERLDLRAYDDYDAAERGFKGDYEAAEKAEQDKDDLRGFAWAIVKDGKIVTSGSSPTAQHTPATEDTTLAYRVKQADQLGGDLYIGGYPDVTSWQAPHSLIMGMTWDEIKTRQHGGRIKQSIEGNMPKGAVLVHPAETKAPVAAAEPAAPKGRIVTPDSLNALRNPVGYGDIVRFDDGSEWTAKDGYSAMGKWSLMQGKTEHPSVRAIDGQVNFIAAIIKANEDAKAKQAKPEAPTIPDGYRKVSSYFKDGKEVDGYAPFAESDRVRHKHNGMQGTVDGLFGSGPVFHQAVIAWDGGTTSKEQWYDLGPGEAKPAAPAPLWHTPMPAEGLPVLAAELKGEGYRNVRPRVAQEAVDAVSMNQKMGNVTLHAYVLAAGPGMNGRVRLLPEDQQAPAGWQKLSAETYHAGMLSPEQMRARLMNELERSKAPVMGSRAVSEVVSPDEYPTKEAAGSYSGISHSGGGRATMDRDAFVDTVQALYDQALAEAKTDAQKVALRSAIDEFKAGYLRQTKSLIAVRSNTYSAYVAGRSGLNSRQANASNRALDKALERFGLWEKKAAPLVMQAVLDARSPEQLADIQRAKDDKSATAQAKNDTFLKRLLDFKAGDEAPKIGSATLVRVNYGKDGLPSSLTMASPDLIKGVNDKIDIVPTLFKTKEALAAAVARVQAQPAAEANSAPEATGPMTLAEQERTMDAARDGTLSVEALQSAYKRFTESEQQIKAEMTANKKDDLLLMAGPFFAHRHRGDNKPDIVKALYEEMREIFALGKNGGISYVMGAGSGGYQQAKNAAIDKAVAGLTAADMQEFAGKVAEGRAERAKAHEDRAAGMADPQTLADYRAILNEKVRGGGMTVKQAILALTPAQRSAFDILVADKARAERATRKVEKQEQAMRAPGEQLTASETIKTRHTKHGHDLWQFTLDQYLSTEEFKQLVAQAKQLGGDYSSYRGNGAIPGWQFKTPEAAAAFKALIAGDASAAKEVMAARRDAFADDKSQSGAERLNEMADRLEEQADSADSAERKTNTARRARFAAAADAVARGQRAMAATMRNLAAAIADGKAKFLDRVRTRTQLDQIGSTLSVGQYAALKAKYGENFNFEKHRYDPITAEAADHAEWPTYTAFRSDLATLGRALADVEGTKLLSKRLLAVANDVSDVYLKFAKQNLHVLGVYALKDGSRAQFASREAAEATIARSGFRGKAIVLPVKRGENLIIMSPTEAVAKGLWTGDGDKRISLDPEFGAELVEKLGKLHRRNRDAVAPPWQMESAHQQRAMWARMGIETPNEMRAALREFIALRQAPAEADKVKTLERAMVGRQNDGLDFFPTPADQADEMIAAADIQPGMRVLEPSAGMGHIADRIREAGFEPDVVEMDTDRRELLEAKGYNLVGRDFMETRPREFYTYGDTFKAPDGTVGIMRGHPSGPAGGRVTLRSEDGRDLGYFDRDELTPVKRNGSDQVAGKVVPRSDLVALEQNGAVRADVLSSVRNALFFYDRGDMEGAAALIERAARQGEFNPDALAAMDGLAERLRGAAAGQYDRIIMNPPFSDRRDVLHVEHAYSLLKPGGRLVAIMGEGSFFGQDKRAQEFRAWLEEHGGSSEKLAEGSFMDPALPVNTGVNARMVVVDKPLVEGKDGAAEHTLYSMGDAAPVLWYSELARQIEKTVTKSAAPQHWLDTIGGTAFAQRGVKRDEIEWSGVLDWLKMQQQAGVGKVSRAQVLDYLAENGVQVEEVTKGEPDYGEVEAWWNDEGGANEDTPFNELTGQEKRDAAQRYADDVGQYNEGESQTTKYSQYTLPGGENYRELLLTLPNAQGKGVTKSGDILFQTDDAVDDFMVDVSAEGLEDLDYRIAWNAAGDRRKVDFKQLTAPHFAKFEQLAAKNGGRVNAEQYHGSTAYKSDHWQEANVLSHVRFNDRIDADGKRVLFVEEIQSDWAQQGKKHGFAGNADNTYEQYVSSLEARVRAALMADAIAEGMATAKAEAFAGKALRKLPELYQKAAYLDEGAKFKGLWDAKVAEDKLPPRAPFVEKTDAWVSLALKRMIRYAAENGYDKVAFVNGQQAADRYDLSKQVEAIQYVKNDDDTFTVYPIPLGMSGAPDHMVQRNKTAKELADVVGKEMAEKIANSEGEKTGAFWTISGIDLKVGGKGMISFYDSIVPNVVNDVLKKLGGGKVGMVNLETAGRWREVEAVDGGFAIRNMSAMRGSSFEYAGTYATKAEADEAMKTIGRTDQPGFDITPALRAKVAGGMPLFSRGAATAPAARTSGMSVADLRASLTEGALGPVIGRLIDAGKVVLHADTSTLRGAKPGVRAATSRGGVIHLVASNLQDANARAVLLHEAFHEGTEKLVGTEAFDALLRRAGWLYRQAMLPRNASDAFMAKALDRVARAKAKGGVKQVDEVEEFAAYAIEEYESAPSSLRKWVNDLIGMVKAWLVKRFGVQLGSVTPAQLSTLARMALRGNDLAQQAMDAAALFSAHDGNRLGLHYKDAVKRTPELMDAAARLEKGEIDRAEYARLVNVYKPVEAYRSVPVPATDKEMFKALTKDKVHKINVPASTVAAGEFVGIRLDIPAYRDHGAWIVAVHEGKRDGKGGQAGKPIGYQSTAHLKNVNLAMPGPGALKIAAGAAKNTLATIGGEWVNSSPAAAAALAHKALTDRAWVQVGIDPERHAYFYNRATMEPIVAGAEAVQIGGLVLVRRPVYAASSNFLFSTKGESQIDSAAFKKWFGDSKVVDKATGKPLVLYRGVHGHAEFAAGALNNEAREGYAVFASPSPYVAASYGNPDFQHDHPLVLGALVPFYVKAEQLIEFPTRPNRYGGNDFDKFAFDDRARRLGPGQVLVARNVVDSGPRGLINIDPKKLYSYGNDVYAFRKGTSTKSATGNNGNFDAASDNMLYSMAPDQISRQVGGTIKGVVNFGKNKGVDYRPFLLQSLGREHLTKVYGDKFTQGRADNLMVQHDKLVNRADAEKNEATAKAAVLVRDWGKLKPKVADALADVMHDATRLGIDPRQPHQLPDLEAEHAELKARYDALTPEAKAIFARAEADYGAHFKDVRESIIERILRIMPASPRRAALMLKMENEFFGKIKGIYFPLARHGNFVVTVTNPNRPVVGSVQRAAVSRAESMQEAQDMRAKLMRLYPASEGFVVGPVTLAKEYNAARDAVGRGFLKEIFDLFEETGEDPVLNDMVNQLYLSSLPDLSWAKHGIHRKGMPGYAKDARRAYADHMAHGAHYLAKMRYSDRLGKVLDDMQAFASAHTNRFDPATARRMIGAMLRQRPGVDPAMVDIALEVIMPGLTSMDPANAAMVIDAALQQLPGYNAAQAQQQIAALLPKLTPYNQVKAQQVVDEMVKRHDIYLNPNTHKLAQWLTAGGFLFHLGLSPASAMVNLTQTALVAYPILGGQYGYVKAGAALLKASKDAARAYKDMTKLLTGDEKRAFEDWVRDGQVDLTGSHNLAGVAAGTDTPLRGLAGKGMEAAAFLFHHAERFNRQTTLLAGYRLAREQGMTHQQAYDMAVRHNKDSHFDYSAGARPRIMQGNVARVVLLFKQYGQNMIFTLVNNARLSFGKRDPEEKRRARWTLSGLLVMHALAAGALGLPLVTTLLAAASMIGGSDDEPWDAEIALRNYLAEAFGDEWGQVVAHGLSRLTPWDISARVGLQSMILPDVQEGLQGVGLMEATMTGMLGPVAGIGVNVAKGWHTIMSKGDWQRGLEEMAPAAFRGGFRAIRYAEEGIKDKTGVDILPETTLAEDAGQLLGFSPSRGREAQEVKSAIYQADEALKQRRTELMGKFAHRVIKHEDTGEIIEQIAHFNALHPQRQIAPMHLQHSVRTHLQHIAQARQGIYLPPKRAIEARQAGRFGDGVDE